jgi:hypothetical protein
LKQKLVKSTSVLLNDGRQQSTSWFGGANDIEFYFLNFLTETVEKRFSRRRLTFRDRIPAVAINKPTSSIALHGICVNVRTVQYCILMSIQSWEKHGEKKRS